MARTSAPCFELRTLVLHTYPDGIKAYGHERITTPMGRRGKSVKKAAPHPRREGLCPGPQIPGSLWHHRLGALSVAGRHLLPPAGSPGRFSQC